MADRFSGSIVAAAIAAITTAVVSASVIRTSAQAPAVSDVALKTPWGEPDLQGIWTEEFDTPFQRPAAYANQEFFTEVQRAALDNKRSALLARTRDRTRSEGSLQPGGLHVRQAHGDANIACCRSAQWTDSTAYRRSSAGGCCRSAIFPRSDASDRSLQEEHSGVPGWEIRSDAVAAAVRSPSSVQREKLRAHQPL